MVDSAWAKIGFKAGRISQISRSDNQHRVTFVSRIAPNFPLASAPPLTNAIAEIDVNSHWELIRRLDPVMRNQLGDPLAFRTNIKRAVTETLSKDFEQGQGGKKCHARLIERVTFFIARGMTARLKQVERAGTSNWSTNQCKE